MKKKMLVIVLALLTAVSFSAAANANGLWIGPTALYYAPMPLSELSLEGATSDDFAYGLDARLRINLFEGSLLSFFSGDAEEGELLIFANAGVNLNLALVNIGASVGTNFVYGLAEDSETEDLGANFKLSADIMLGNLAVGGYFLTVAPTVSDINFDDLYGFVGLSGLFKLF